MTDRIQLAYTDTGSGHPVILVHGFCGSSAYWDKIRDSLSTQLRVITPDLRGHGRSEAPDLPYTMEAIADDLAELVQRLELGKDKPVLLGHSLGGYVALAFTERFAPLLAGFGLIHSTAYPDSEQAKENRNKAIDSIQQNGIRPFMDGLVPKLFAPEHLESMSELVELAKEIGYATSPTGAIHTAEAMRDRLDRNYVLQNTTLPVLLVAGEQDQIIPVDKTFSIQASHITQVRIQHAGHMSMLEAPEELEKTIVSFVNSCS